MQTDRAAGRTNGFRGGLSHLLDIAAPLVVIAITAVLVLERTPRREPILYATLIAGLTLLTWASTRSRGAYALWAVYIGAFALFSLIRTFADETGMPTQVGSLIAAERGLFGTVPTAWLQERLFEPTQIGWLDRLTTYIHWSYFVLPHIFAAHLYFGHRRLFKRYVMLFAGVLAVGLVIYFAFPAAPPWVASATGHLEPTHKIVTEVGSELRVNIYRYMETQIRASNPVAAMPSVHMAVSVVVLLTAFRVSWPLGVLALAYNGAMAFSLVYLGEHYVIDILAGIAVTVVVYAALTLWWRLRQRGEEELEGAPDNFAVKPLSDSWERERPRA